MNTKYPSPKKCMLNARNAENSCYFDRTANWYDNSFTNISSEFSLTSALKFCKRIYLNLDTYRVVSFSTLITFIGKEKKSIEFWPFQCTNEIWIRSEKFTINSLNWLKCIPFQVD